jgi:hypothetical protein
MREDVVTERNRVQKYEAGIKMFFGRKIIY